MARITARDVHEAALRDDADYRREYGALEEEFKLIAARLDAGAGSEEARPGPAEPGRRADGGEAA